MSPIQRHIKSQFNTNYEEPYATIAEPTNATIISEEIVETNEKEACIRQTSQVVHAESRLAEDT